MSLLDINDVESQLNELNYLLYDNFVYYLSKHVPKQLWRYGLRADNNGGWGWSTVNYIKFQPATLIRKDDNYTDMDIMCGVMVSETHLCIHITPTDDGLVNIEFPKRIYDTFPILISPGEHVPKTILKLLEPLKDKLEIIEGCL